MLEKISTPLYNNSIVIDFFPEKHWYKIDWKFITSVTAITWIVDKSAPLMHRATGLVESTLHQYIDNWRVIDKEMITQARFEYKNVSKAATDVWTLVHDRCEAFSKWVIKPMPADQQAQRCLKAFVEWTKANNVKFLCAERYVYSKKHWYWWKCDYIAEVNWLKYLIDLKTSKWMYYLPYWMQTSGYKEAYEEETWDMLDWTMVLMLPKEEWYEFEVHYFEDPRADFVAFLWAFELLKRKKIVDKYEKEIIK